MNYKRIYLNGYSYYLTLVTQGRKHLLVDNIEILRDSFRRSKKKYDYNIDAIVVLPDHLHMIITPKIAKDYSHIVRHIKRSFIYGLDKETKANAKSDLKHSKQRRGHAGVWQERFYEHTIRDEKDMFKIMQYIKYNPIKHKLVEEIKDWKYSSFI